LNSGGSKVADVFLGLGSNDGNRENNIRQALAFLANDDRVEMLSVSSLYETKPLGESNQPDFINCVARIKTDYQPLDLLKFAKKIEMALGRQPDTHMLPRPMDIDILLYDDIDLDSLELRIPHSRLTSRRFVLEPLLEIDETIIHPITGRPLKDSLEEVKSQEVIKSMDSTER
jgi:2-amino-4-hydroxy-6-hydroxymethyldihydropteridine diphosphokinase